MQILLTAPDVYFAAAAFSTKDFYYGRGDRTAFFKMILETNPKHIPDLGKKLALVTKTKFLDLELYND